MKSIAKRALTTVVLATAALSLTACVNNVLCAVKNATLTVIYSAITRMHSQPVADKRERRVY